MTHCLFIPLDGRPCNARFPMELARFGGHSLQSPESRLLGNAKQPAALKALDRWLATVCEMHSEQESLALFLSLDTWLYGNLVASRKSTQTLAQVLERLAQLKQLKAKYPQLKIYTMGTLLRLSNSNDDTEERPYWAQYGEKIYRYSWLTHYLQEHPEATAEVQELEALSEVIPEEVLADYQALRQRNLNVLEAVFEGLQSGWLELCLLGCDDGGQYGWNVQEKAHLRRLRDSLQLQDKLMIYPGADELGSVLMARVLVPDSYTLKLEWTSPTARHEHTRYEGIPLCDTLSAQAEACQIALQDEKHAADTDGILWIHNAPRDTVQIDQFLDREQRTVIAKERYQALSETLRGTLPVMVADVIYANGGDAHLLEYLDEHTQFLDLAGYAAWNTTGNTVGYVLAWYKFYLYHRQHHSASDSRLPQRLLMERLCDDGLYQGLWRQEWCQHYQDPVTLNTCVQGIYAFNQRLKHWAQTYDSLDSEAPPQIKQLSFPWKRFFEVDLQICWPEQCAPLM